MFTGIIESIAEVFRKDEETGCFLEIGFQKALEMQIGDSIAVNGVCLSVLAIHPADTSKQRGNSMNSFRCFASKETLELTNLQYLESGSFVNLERALVFAKSRLNGHIVMGHADGYEEVLEIQKQKQSHIFRISLRHIEKGHRYLIRKGSITLNGISLTVYSVHEESFTVMIIPHSFKHTNLHILKPGQMVNIEFDMIAKYVENFQSSIK